MVHGMDSLATGAYVVRRYVLGPRCGYVRSLAEILY